LIRSPRPNLVERQDYLFSFLARFTFCSSKSFRFFLNQLSSPLAGSFPMLTCPFSLSPLWFSPNQIFGPSISSLSFIDFRFDRPQHLVLLFFYRLSSSALLSPLKIRSVGLFVKFRLPRKTFPLAFFLASPLETFPPFSPPSSVAETSL